MFRIERSKVVVVGIVAMLLAACGGSRQSGPQGEHQTSVVSSQANAKRCLDVVLGSHGGLTNLNLSGCDLRQLAEETDSPGNFGQRVLDSDFSNANLKGLDLTGGYFYGSNFTGADFSGATLSDTNFWGANLTGARFSAGALENDVSTDGYAMTDSKTTCPDGSPGPCPSVGTPMPN